MDFSRFLETYTADVDACGPTAGWTAQDTQGLLGCRPAGYTEFVSRVARNSYSDGLLRFLLAESDPSIRTWNAEGWVADWRAWDKRFIVFGYDWLGRQLGFDLQRRKRGEPLVGILEPGTAQMLEVPCTFSEFLLEELIDHADAALAASFFEAWRTAGGKTPRPVQCVGYTKPLFLGGSDTVDNLELCDLAVYVSLCGQMASQTQNLRPGGPIKSVKID
jgi:hypothetical protein